MHKNWIMRVVMGVLAWVVLAPMGVFAHGGFEKSVGGVTLYINQTPLSPLVGEQVTVNIVLQKAGRLDRLREVPVTVELVDTYYGDERKDAIVETQVFRTDANGSFNYVHTFTKQNYFDVNISFVNPDTQERVETGFLIYPRTGREDSSLVLPPSEAKFSWRWTVLAVAVLGVCAGYGIGVRR